jgi:hypothetical protein
MSLQEQIKKEEEELAKLEALENEESTEEQAEEQEEEVVEDENGEDDENEVDAESDGEEGEAPEEEVAKAAPEEEIKNPNDTAAKLRIERRERLKAQEELAELRRRHETHDFKPQQQPQQEPLPEPEPVEERLARIENQQYNANLQQQAQQELTSIESEFIKTTPDYPNASTHMIKSMHQGAKAAFPNMDDRQAIQFVQGKVMEIASRAAQNNQNPAEVFYQMAYDHYGYKPEANNEAESAPKVNKVKNLRAVAKNKRRSASPLSGGGQVASSNVTMEQAIDMDVADFGKLSDSQFNDLMNQV